MTVYLTTIVFDFYRMEEIQINIHTKFFQLFKDAYSDHLLNLVPVASLFRLVFAGKMCPFGPVTPIYPT